MKRDLKFRCWHEHYGMKSLDQITFTEKTWLCENGHGVSIPYQPSVQIMQFTGREDCDGNEVYEGDIIENCDTKLLQTVFWNNDESAFYCQYVDDQKRVVSLADSLGNLNIVVGNIFENTDLIYGVATA